MSPSRVAALVAAGVLTTGPSVFAQQQSATYRWQTHPYCNVLIINVAERAGIYGLDGKDDRCGAADGAASAVGTAFVNPDGSVGLGLTLVFPGATPVFLDATIDVSSLSGTWRDSTGHAGDLVFTPGPAIASPPRPVPPFGLADGSVTSLKIAPGAIGAVQLAENSISGAKIVDGSIQSADWYDAPRAMGVGDQQSFVLSTDVITQVRTVTINVPATGNVIVNASGYFQFGDPNVTEYAKCTISNTPLPIEQHAVYASEAWPNSMNSFPFGITRSFPVTAGSATFNLFCWKIRGEVVLKGSSVTAIYVAGS